MGNVAETRGLAELFITSNSWGAEAMAESEGRQGGRSHYLKLEERMTWRDIQLAITVRPLLGDAFYSQ